MRHLSGLHIGCVGRLVKEAAAPIHSRRRDNVAKPACAVPGAEKRGGVGDHIGIRRLENGAERKRDVIGRLVRLDGGKRNVGLDVCARSGRNADKGRPTEKGLSG